MPRSLSKPSQADRGKEAEKLVEDFFTEQASKDRSAMFMRIPDFRAGSRTAKPGDYWHVRYGVPYLIEVKQVNHGYRLPFNNFDTGQAGRMRRFAWAGAKAAVLIYFTPLKQWRFMELESLRYRDPKSGSWDLSHIQPSTLDDAILAMYNIGEQNLPVCADLSE